MIVSSFTIPDFEKMWESSRTALRFWRECALIKDCTFGQRTVLEIYRAARVMHWLRIAMAVVESSWWPKISPRERARVWNNVERLGKCILDEFPYDYKCWPIFLGKNCCTGYIIKDKDDIEECIIWIWWKVTTLKLIIFCLELLLDVLRNELCHQ